MIELLVLQPITVEQALEALRSAYTTGTIADRMTYETRRDDGTFDAVSVELRIDAADGARSIRYETSGFAFHAQRGRLAGSGVGPPEPRRVLIAENEPFTAAEMLTGVIPTGPLPQLWTIDRNAVSDPSLGAVQFTDVSTSLGTTTITGASAFGAVHLETDAITGRLVTLRAPLRDGSIELRASPIEPGDPSDWIVSTDHRRIVSRIDQLAPNLSMHALGELLPDSLLKRPDGASLSLVDWHEMPADGPQSPWSVILFADATRVSPDEARRNAEDVLRSIEAEADGRRKQAGPAERFWLRFRPLIVLVLPDDGAFDREPVELVNASADVLISARPDLTIDRLPLAPIVAVAIDSGRVIGAISETNSGAEAPLRVDRFVDQLVAPASNPSE